MGLPRVSAFVFAVCLGLLAGCAAGEGPVEQDELDAAAAALREAEQKVTRLEELAAQLTVEVARENHARSIPISTNLGKDVRQLHGGLLILWAWLVEVDNAERMEEIRNSAGMYADGDESKPGPLHDAELTGDQKALADEYTTLRESVLRNTQTAAKVIQRVTTAGINPNATPPKPD
jgi:hypothetical protein